MITRKIKIVSAQFSRLLTYFRRHGRIRVFVYHRRCAILDHCGNTPEFLYNTPGSFGGYALRRQLQCEAKKDKDSLPRLLSC